MNIDTHDTVFDLKPINEKYHDLSDRIFDIARIIKDMKSSPSDADANFANKQRVIECMVGQDDLVAKSLDFWHSN